MPDGAGSPPDGMSSPTVGVLAFQGDFERHQYALESAGAHALRVRHPHQVASLDGLILPGGESTTIGMLLARFGLDTEIETAARDGMPIMGTCAGSILLAREIHDSDQPRLGLMDITVARNAYGRQIESFEADIALTFDDVPFRAVFIRAPIITEIKPQVSVLASFESRPVMVSQDNLVALTFHPELTADLRLHRHFLDIVRRR